MPPQDRPNRKPTENPESHPADPTGDPKIQLTLLLTPRKRLQVADFKKKHLSMSMNIGDIQKLMLLLCEKARNAM
jgi:hypothetical protein